MNRVLPTFDFVRPDSLQEALLVLAVPGARVCAGGSGLVESLSQVPLSGVTLVDIMRIPGLDAFAAHPKIGVRLGARTLMSTLISDIWVAKRWAALHEAIEQIHPPEIANVATVVGALCSAGADFDISAALLAHRARLHIAGLGGVREVSLEDFHAMDGLGLAAGELVTGIAMPPPAADAGSAFKRLRTAGSGADFPHVAVAAYVALDAAKEALVDVSLSLKLGQSLPMRLTAVEAALAGTPAETAHYSHAADIVLDILGSAVADDPLCTRWIGVLVRDVLEQAASRARSRHDPAEDAHLAY